MSFKSSIKSGIRFILNNIPAKKINVRVVSLSPNELLEGRTALITGGTSGIGFHMAKAFLRSGAAVVITGRSKERLLRTCAELDEDGAYAGRLSGLVMDNARTEKFQECFHRALEQTQIAGRSHIDILVNNAGVLGAALSDATEEEYDTVMDTNLKGAFFLSRLFGKYLKENGIAGNILNVGSSSSLRPAISAYTLSKWGIRGLTLGLAKALAPYGITVNGIAPGPTMTPMLLKEDVSSTPPNLLKNPIGRYAYPEEIANMAVILVSDMCRTVVGDMLYMTGGAGVITYDDAIDYTF